MPILSWQNGKECQKNVFIRVDAHGVLQVQVVLDTTHHVSLLRVTAPDGSLSDGSYTIEDSPQISGGMTLRLREVFTDYHEGTSVFEARVRNRLQLDRPAQLGFLSMVSRCQFLNL